MPIQKLALTIATLFVLSGCAIAPLNNMTSAHTAGRGKMDLSLGATINPNEPRAQINYGLLNSLDVGFVYETIDAGLTVKWSPLNRQESGLSAALTAGVGGSVGGFYWNAGPVVSYSFGFAEPYLAFRFNQAMYSSNASVAAGTITVVPTSTSYTYTYYSLGSLFWFTPNFGFGVEGNLFGMTTNATLSSYAPVFGASFLFKL